MLELFELNVVDGELVPPKAWEAIQHLGEYDWAEATVFLAGQLKQTGKAKARLDVHEVDEIAGLRPAEHGEHLVGREFFGGQEVEARARLCGEEPGVAREVHLRSIEFVRDDKAGESRAVDQPIDLESGLLEC